MAQVLGTSGNDLIDGATNGHASFDDELIGLGGDDTYRVYLTSVFVPPPFPLPGLVGETRYFRDTVTEAANDGNDTVYFINRSGVTELSATIWANVENIIGRGGPSFGSVRDLTHWHFIGNALNNHIEGDRGNDSLNGGPGRDVLVGAAGNDSYQVDDPGDQVIEAPGEGTDHVSSSISFSLAGQHIENATLTGGGNAALTGNELDNTLIGNSGNNVLDGRSGADSMRGGSGDDTYFIDSLNDDVVESAGAGFDLLISSIAYAAAAGQSIEHLMLGTGADVNLTGNELDNILTGGNGANQLAGGNGNDTLVGRGGPDTLIGGAGNDTFEVEDVGDQVVEGIGGGTDLVRTLLAFNLGGQFVENATLITGADRNLIGNGQDNRLTGGDGVNWLDGKGGDDNLDGGRGADTLEGGSGNDTYEVDNAGDRIIEDAAGGTDLVRSMVGLNLRGQFVENASLTTGADVNLIGNDLNNVLKGGNGSNWLDGKAGDDTLDGGAGADTLEGGTGNDTYEVDSLGDRVLESPGAGSDLVRSTVALNLGGQFVENATLTSGADVNLIGNGVDNVLTGGNGSNWLDGKTGNDTLVGGAGADTLEGGAGDDTYDVDNAGDRVLEAAFGGLDLVLTSIAFNMGGQFIENATLTGSASANLIGNGLDNVLTGGSGANWLDGKGGNDSLSGELGADTLEGGSGADRFIYNSVNGSPTGLRTRDVIADFNAADGDKIDLSAIDANTGLAGDQTFTFIGSAAFSAAGQLRFTNGVLYANVDFLALPDFEVRLLGVSSLVASDFIP